MSLMTTVICPRPRREPAIHFGFRGKPIVELMTCSKASALSSKIGDPCDQAVPPLIKLNIRSTKAQRVDRIALPS
jgi:hypothetical protein